MTKHRNNKEKTILAAAKEEFLDKGYDGARTTSIARNAGVTHAMLHYYFKTKEQLFVSIFEDLIGEVVEQLTVLLSEGNKPLVERLQDGLLLHFDFVTKNPRIPVFAIREILSHPERLNLVKGKISPIVSTLYITVDREIKEAQKRGEITADIDAPRLLIDMVSLNMFPLFVQPIFKEILGDEKGNLTKYLETRRKETLETITRRLKP